MSLTKSSTRATKEMVAYCFDSLVFHFENKPIYKPTFSNDSLPLFVTWKINKKSNEGPVLRGCIGTFEEKSLVDGLHRFALTSALKDSRFSAIKKHELEKLHCAVSLLIHFEDASDCWDWEIGVHGIWIEFTDPIKKSTLNGTFLPEVMPEQEWTKEEAMKSLIKKAGYNGKVDDTFYASIKLTRYQSSKDSLSYHEYLEFKKVNLTPI